MHKVKIKNMRCDNNNYISFKKYIIEDFKYRDYEGKISLGIIKQLKPIIANRNGKKILINSEDDVWLQIGLKNLPYWLTGLYNKERQLIEFYFDIIKDSNLELENPIYYDMYLDLVYTKNKELIVLDAEELDKAFEEKLITEEEYNKAKTDLEKLIRFINDNSDELFEICQNKVNELYKKL